MPENGEKWWKICWTCGAFSETVPREGNSSDL